MGYYSSLNGYNSNHWWSPDLHLEGEEKMSNPKKWFLVFGIIIIVIIFINRENIHLFKEQKQKTEASKKTFEEMLKSLPPDELTSLLAIKYGIDEKILNKAERDYSALIYPIDKESKKMSVSGVIDKLSLQYQIPKQTLVSILLDEKMIKDNE